jgi:hypothetical protein
VLTCGIGAFRTHTIAYRFRWKCRLWRHFAGQMPALPANCEIMLAHISFALRPKPKSKDYTALAIPARNADLFGL